MASEFPRTALDYFQQYELDRQVPELRARLRQKAQSICDSMEELIRDLDADRTINSLGELQGRGSELDRLCGMYTLVKELARDLAKAREYDAAKSQEN